MAAETALTITGNLTADPELRFTPNGVAVANFTIASTHRFLQDGTWTDGDTVFLAATVWRTQAELAAEHLTKGTRVIATGRLRQRSYETDAGERRTVTELEIDELGKSLRYPPKSSTRDHNVEATATS